jgi:hypothetical protein
MRRSRVPFGRLASSARLFRLEHHIKPPIPPSQLLAGLVKLGNSSRTSTYEPLLSRRYGYILLGRYVVELELSETLRLVTFKFYVENAVNLLQQVESCLEHGVGGWQGRHFMSARTKNGFNRLLFSGGHSHQPHASAALCLVTLRASCPRRVVRPWLLCPGLDERLGRAESVHSPFFRTVA